MKIEYISQPFPPEGNWLGHQLRSLLTGQRGHFDRFIAMVAFVKFSGVSRLYSAFEEFRKSGGQSIVTVGINHGGTSKQGLRLLRQAVDQLFIYYDNAPERRTFHPKTYVFEQVGKRAIVILGSGNMTAGGLFTNYETHVRLELNLSDDSQYDEDRKLFAEMMATCQSVQDTTSECVQELTDDSFAQLEMDLPDESQPERETESASETDDEATTGERPQAEPSRSSAISTMFGSSKFSRAPRPDITMGEKRHGAASVGGTRPENISEDRSTPVRGFWKMLSGNDVSTTSSPGQIIIPIRFRQFFEPLPLTKPADPGGKGRQWDAIFPVRFADEGYAVTVDARCIVYEPETGHPRPNTECRFTFRSREILERLVAGDILVFREATNAGLRFEVERVSASDPRHSLLLSDGKTTFGWLV